MSNYYLFLATFGVVFMLGFQSLSVQSGNYSLAAINSVIIGVFNLMLLRTVPFVDAPQQIAIYIAAGPVGIIVSMLVHRKIVAPWRERVALRKEPPSAIEDELDRAFWRWLYHKCPNGVANGVHHLWTNSPEYAAIIARRRG